MSKEEFEKYIESIGFICSDGICDYEKHHGVDLLDCKMYTIICHSFNYILYNGVKGKRYSYNDLTPLRKFDRGYKLKKILG